MKKFNEYITEEITPQALTDKEFVGVESESVRDNINSLLSGVTTKPVVTPYISLERIRKALAYYHIFIPAHQFMDGNSGNVIFNINQFGQKYGQTNSGEFVTKNDSPYSLYFEYQMNDSGLFDVFAEIVDDDDLEELINDYESESEDAEGDDTVVSADQQNSYLINKEDLKESKKEDDEDENEAPFDAPTKTPSTPYKNKGAKAKQLARAAMRKAKGLNEAKRVVTATKKAEKGTKWKLISRNPDSEGSDMELRQGKRVKMAGGFYRDSQDFGLLPTKKGKMNMKAKSQYFDTPADIMKTVKEDYPGVMRRSNKSLDPDLQKDFKDYKSDQQEKRASNAVKTSWQASPNPTFRTMGTVKPWKTTDSRAKYDATRDKIVDKQNQREIRRDPPITVKEEQQLTEISRKLAKKAEHKAAKKYYDAYDAETDARKKVQKEKTPEARKGAEDAKAVRTKAAKRVMKFQQYADKKKKMDEDYESEPAMLAKKYAAYAKHEKAMSKSNSLAAQLSPLYRNDMAYRSKRSKAISKKYNKKAVTGLDEETKHSYGEHGALVASAINHFGTSDHPAADQSNLHLFNKKYVKSVLKKAQKKVNPEYADKISSLINGLKEENINELSRATAERAYASARDKGHQADRVSSILSHDDNKSLRKQWQKRANKKWAQARKFADYSDKKK